MIIKPNEKYAFTDKEFLLSPEAESLRSLANSLYPSYLSKLNQEGKKMKINPIPALDENFVISSEALWFRVLSETIYTEFVLRNEAVQHTVLWFGSARINTKDFKPNIKMPNYYKQAEELAKKFTKWSLGCSPHNGNQAFMICTGGGPGIMEAGNRGSKKAGGRSIGLNIQLPMEQYSNKHISQELEFNFQYFFTRKYHFLKRAKAAVVFPGGYGSFDELFETLTLIQTKKINPIKIILFGVQFWKDVIDLEKLVDYGTISKSDLDLFEFHDDVDKALESLTKELKPLIKKE